MHEWINKLTIPDWVKVALRASLPFLVAAAVKYADEFVKTTSTNVDDVMWLKFKEALKELGLLD